MSLAAIDWAQPWLAPYRAIGEAAARAALHTTSVAAALQQGTVPGASPEFVPQFDLPAGQAYEAHIFQTGTVPTRDNLHDFFNGLVWLAFPQTKRRLNELQAAEIARRGIASTRGALRDALTLFDENGAVLDAPAPLWKALAARDWHSLFVTQRALWAEARLLVFGHALLEKLATPRKALTAHVLLPLPEAGRQPALDDGALARSLHAEYLVQKPFVPLPVLGVPGWWPENELPDFYDDSKVFRPGR
ncbi:DUF3025 domain-containing protein [Variovorax paradoxus]|uniref:DUF3025 domain-containing protein n=1 Tax=Variovorax paradoxus TaxID=34073 RepID=A0A6I6HF38_VARPD|nr:DUF3025 domain-containing protein [Variovorax paradoxus]QGW80798.1 DUF3025 domain-containing protein [Variovorax paradoxus]